MAAGRSALGALGRPAEALTEDDGLAEEEVPEVRRLLLQEEHAVRAEPRRAVPDLPPSRARARAGAAAVVRVPHPADARRLRLPHGARALRNARRRTCSRRPRAGIDSRRY